MARVGTVKILLIGLKLVVLVLVGSYLATIEGARPSLYRHSGYIQLVSGPMRARRSNFHPPMTPMLNPVMTPACSCRHARCSACRCSCEASLPGSSQGSWPTPPLTERAPAGPVPPDLASARPLYVFPLQAASSRYPLYFP